MSDHEIPEEIARRLRPLGESPVPDANPALAAFLADPVSPPIEHGELAATGRQSQPTPNRRDAMKLVLGDLLGAVARLGLVGKVALGAAAVAIAGMGSATAVSAVIEEGPPSVPVVQTVDNSTAPSSDPSTAPTDDATDTSDDTTGSDKSHNQQGSDQNGTSSDDDSGAESDDHSSTGTYGDDDESDDHSSTGTYGDDDESDDHSSTGSYGGDESDGQGGSGSASDDGGSDD